MKWEKKTSLKNNVFFFCTSEWPQPPASLVAQMVKHLPTVWKTQVRFLGWEDPLEKQMANHSSILAWKNPMDGEAWWVQSMGSQRVGHNWAISLSLSSHQIKRKESLPVFHQRFPPSHRLAPPGDTALSMCGHRCYSPCVNSHHSAFRYGSLETRSEIFLIHNFWFILFLSKWQELWGSHLLVIQISNWSLGKGLWKLGKQSRTRNYMALEQASLYGNRRPDHSRPPPSKALKVAGQNQKLSDTQRSRCQSHYELWIFPEINHQLLNLIFKKQYTIL